MYYVYVLQSLKRNYIYVGLTNHVDRRFAEHQRGKQRVTAPYRPFLLIHVEQYQTRPAARTREKYLKSGCGKEWIKKNILCAGGEMVYLPAGR
ncbi:MAG: hypothetical protein COU35_01410, partial [Candidatus Magasanikbacteria bacterium CG10_big_fil_rev_8_21_14_0_10_47_10]